MTRTSLVALLALCVLAPALAGVDTRESTENEEEVPPLRFPEDKALPFDREKVPTQKPPLEAIDMKNAAGPNETERVDHPNVNDPGTTHAEGTEEGGRGSIRACTLPKLRDSSSNSSASDWLADSGNVTKVCHLPVQWLHGASGTLRVCSLPHDAWTSNITITDGTIPKELLAQLNTTGAKCVTPSEALSGNGSTGAVDSFANGSIPSAWLRDSNDTIYIYFIPQEWLRAGPPPTAAPAPAGPASEVEDLIKDDRDAAAPTPDPSAATGALASVTAIAVSNATATATTNSTVTASANVTAAAADTDTTTTKGVNASAVDATVAAAATTAFPADVASNTTGVGAGAAAAVVSKTNSTTIAPAASNSTNTATIAIAQATESNGTNSATIAPAVPPAASAIPTQKPKEETTNATDKPKEDATKPVVMPKEITTKQSAKPTQEATKGTEKPATQTTLATKKPEEKVTEQAAGKTTEKPKDAAKAVQHSDAENEIGHGGDALHLPEALSQENSQRSHAESSAKTAFLQPTESAAILAGVFVAIALLGYAGLLLWRRVLEKRYGNREMLVNEDDDFDTSDMRHFEL